MTESFANSTLSPALRQATHAVDVPEDPWPGFARRERRHRRTRLIRAAAAAAVGVALVGVQTNVVPLPGWAPGIAVAAAPAALLDAPPRGSLAGDRAWLETLRARISTDIPLGGGSRDGIWKVGDRDRIRLLYGSDQPGHRVALVAVPLRFGLLTKEALVWYVGPAGTDAQQMRYAGHSEDVNEPVMTLMQAEPGRSGFAVVVGPVDSTVTISGEPRYTPAGTLEYEDLARADGRGVGFAALPAVPLPGEPVVRVSRGDHVLYQGGLGGGPYAGVDPTGQEMDALLTAARRGARGTPMDDANLRNYIELALVDSRLPAAGTTVRVRWSSSEHGQAAALLTVQPVGGGVIAYARHGDERTGWWTDLRLLLPAEGADQRPVGWRIREDIGTGTPTDQVRVIAPPDAARVTVTAGGAPPAPVTLDVSNAGTTRIPPDQSATFTAYAADGRVLGTTPLPPVEADMSGLPGDSPATRVTP
ncbi:hypothetical protein [Micromonospora parathelypteridis]|uniref:Uncharacterized protein n=1 Tax=Micromonospora parathelypteridis TaxID=1839617 RepID=A0A840W099_9ACTN|nr:hypothetical protein [Micromonospora parathelypteridis]MBB5477739.1 hypothetical protein [Micromonospora parathelypteridis]GGO11384.1 hypothetical protein GCM10011576_19780 [Micromonospora parathelypteridis]